MTGKAVNGGYQKYTTCTETLVCPIPDSVPYSNAVVLPLSISTATCALFDILGLDPPSLNPTPKGKTVLVWGGASSCGSTAIQLATAAGYDVATTASPHNFDYVKALGATHVFDYNKKVIQAEILAFMKSVKSAGVFDSVGSEKLLRYCERNWWRQSTTSHVPSTGTPEQRGGSAGLRLQPIVG